MSADESGAATAWPQTVIGRFVARRSYRSALLWAVILGSYVASKSIGYAATYPTLKARLQLTATLGNNVGLDALFGAPHHLEQVTGFTAWNALGLMIIVGAVWGLLLATKTFRGEENAGCWELLLAGQTTARRAAANALAGLTVALLVLYVGIAIIFSAIGAMHSVGFGVHAALYFALAAIASAAEFVVIGSLASQLMPTRSRAASLAAGFFAICFLLRAMGDTAQGAHWLVNISPLGWVENLQPLYGARPLWLLPIAGFVLVAAALTIFLAGQRDLGASFFSDTETARPRTALLGTPFAAAVRLTRLATVSWLLAVAVVGLAFGLITKAAAQAFAASLNAQHVVDRLAGTTQATGALTYLGIVFFILMAIMMSYAASAVGAMRSDEAEGYLDNLLVRPVGRLQWLGGRVVIIFVAIVCAGVLDSLCTWAGVAAQHLSVPAHQLWIAGVNAMAPAVLTLGVAIAGFGFVPRLTMPAGYVVIAWSFLVQMASSGINLNHWILDTSVLHHITLAPATSTNWTAVVIVSGIGIVAAILGALRFQVRDLETE